MRYDALGQLTNVVYPVSPALTLQYDVLGRLTNLVDGVGQTRYSYANNRLASEDGPWAEDTVSYSYQYAGLRGGLTLLQPNGSPWAQSYGYDAAERLTSVVSPAGSFGYAYDSTRVALPGTLTLPNGATIATSYDFMARLTNTTLRTSQQAVLNHHGYGYNAASQRTSVTNLAGNTVGYTYDRIGQLTQASGKEAGGTTRLNEQFEYGFDDIGNRKSTGGRASAVGSYTNNLLNQLTGRGVAPYVDVLG
ncbi:MAG: RHS repeat protein, partial [Verrucomicrobia bacterium]|nr:RHS repeat protein [Verrucomicrobiota bacterium]